MLVSLLFAAFNMISVTFLLTIGGIISLALFAALLRHRSYWRRRDVPGPRPHLLLGNLQQMGEGANGVGLDFKRLHEWTRSYGPTFGVQQGWTNVLVTSDLGLLRSAFVQNAGCFEERNLGPLKAKLRPHGAPTHVFNAAGSEWKQLRHETSPAFSVAEMKKLLPLIATATRKVMAELLTQGGGAKSAPLLVDIHPHMMAISRELLHMMATGLPSPQQLPIEQQPCHPVGAPSMGSLTAPSTNNNTPSKSSKFFRSWLRRFLRRIEWLLHPWLAYPITMVFSAITPHSTDKEDLYVKFHRAHSSTAGVPTDERDGREDGSTHSTKMGDILLAGKMRSVGFDTVAAALSCALHCLAGDEEAQRELQREVDEMVVMMGCENASANKVAAASADLTYTQLANMPWLDAVLKETLRLYPIVTFANARRCKSACTLSSTTSLPGLRIDEGVIIQPNVFSVHRSKCQWGDDADEFRPRRWLDTSHGAVANGEAAAAATATAVSDGGEEGLLLTPLPNEASGDEDAVAAAASAWLAFGAGRRRCLGERFAYVWMKCSLSVIIREFSVGLPMAKVGIGDDGRKDKTTAADAVQARSRSSAAIDGDGLELVGENVLAPASVMLELRKRTEVP